MKGNNVLKYIYRIIILLCIFVASIYYFSRDIKEVVFDMDNTIAMENATFPLITIKTGENEINLLHGYSSNLNANMVREAVTPIGTDQTFEVLINQEKYDIKKLNYELREFASNDLIETNSISVFEDNGSKKTAKIKLKPGLETGKEYAVKITLITSESKKMYYYQRIKLYENSYLNEKLAFVMGFHNAIKNKETAKEIERYLEKAGAEDNTSLSYVNINSSLDLVSWGNLQPVFLTEVIPTIKEIYSDTASVELDYYIEADIAGTTEQYQITEFYRVRYTADRMYLLNYERRMEAQFDVNLASIVKNELKLGISNEMDVPFISSDDEKKMAFVRDRELWYYDLNVNEMIRVFSFRQDQTDYIRDLYDQHDIRLLNMDAEGNVDFLVYGYMNRGQYEGKVAVILFRYVRAENRIEELVYLPVEGTYQTLKENLGDFSYVNSKEVFYFHINNNIYSFNLITRELSELATNIHQNNIVVLKELNYVTWQENTNPTLAKKICIMDMETGDVQSISAEAGYNARLMGKIDSNIIYGFVKEKDIITMMDGKILAPLGTIEIASVNKDILKSYEKPDYYIYDLKVMDNVIELYQVQKVSNSGNDTYVKAPDDYIMNQVKAQTQVIKVSTRVTEQALTELYLSLPAGFTMSELPKVTKTVNTIISQDPTVRLQETEQEELYYPYITGGIEGSYEEAVDAIEVAKEKIGVVLDNKQRLVWEKGVKATQSIITYFEEINLTARSNKSIESCLEIMLSYQNVNVGIEKLSVANRSAFDVLKEYSKYSPIRLTGITLDDALYYISKGRPVLAITDTNKAVLIYGYDAFNIMMIDPTKSEVVKVGIGDSTNLFKNAGNVFLSYLEQ